MAPLSRLAGSLTLQHVAHGEVPASLAALTNLRHLRLLDCRPEEASNEALAAALPHLTQLTRLVSTQHVQVPLLGSACKHD